MCLFEAMVITGSRFGFTRYSNLLLFSYGSFQKIPRSSGINEEQQFCLIPVIRKY